ncbi:hypothetical protein G9A89_008497 [Geosiphon pyriformis]|nr:hypothetical protein G9A89_008497 [Geosiphon pyriformis]
MTDTTGTSSSTQEIFDDSTISSAPSQHLETLTQITARHKKELKELAARTIKLKKTVTKGDKKRKKEIQAEILILEQTTDERQANELISYYALNVGQEVEHGEVETKAAGGEAVSENTLTNKGKSGPINNKLASEEKDAIDDDEENIAEEENFASRSINQTKKDASLKAKPKYSRQKKRKEKAMAKFKELQDQAEKEVDGQINMKEVELEAIKSLTEKMDLTIKQIIPDGHCLYNAIADQLSTQYNIMTDYKDIRKNVAEYMRQNSDDFLPFLSTESGDLYTMEQFQRYCYNLENTADWGGQLELRAASKFYEIPIYIVQMGLPLLKISEDEFTNKKPITLSYHRYMYGLGEHYNSLREK